jgi:hypothetical protein
VLQLSKLIEQGVRVQSGHRAHPRRAWPVRSRALA